MRCAVKNCKNNNTKKPCTISFFSFPSDPKLIKKWRSFCGRGKDWNPKTSQICMEHFKPEDFENELQYKLGFTKRRLLKSGAVPSVGKLSSVDGDEREKRKQKRENKRIVEMLIKEHDAQTEALLKANVKNEPSVETIETEIAAKPELSTVTMAMEIVEKPELSTVTMETEIVAKPKLSKVTDLLKERLKEYPSKTNDLATEIERLRIENYILKETTQKQEAELIAFKKERDKAYEKYECTIKGLKTHLNRVNYELYNLEEKLLGIFSKGQITKLKAGEKRIHWSDEDLSQGVTLYETSPKLYKLLYRKRFPLPSVRAVQVYRRKCLNKHMIQMVEYEIQQDLEGEINEAVEEEEVDMEEEEEVDMEEEINEHLEIDIKEELEDKLNWDI